MKGQLPGFSDEKAQDFQVLEAFGGFLKNSKRRSAVFSRLPGLQGGEEDVLLLTQQFANLGQLSLEEQKSNYRHVFTYYLEGRKILIKPHPDDILYYSRLFPRCRILRDPFPCELLPFVFQKLPRTLCTVSSTGVNQIRQEFSDTLSFNSLTKKAFTGMAPITLPCIWQNIFWQTGSCVTEPIWSSWRIWQRSTGLTEKL